MTTPPPDKSPDPISSGKPAEPLGSPSTPGKPAGDFGSHMGQGAAASGSTQGPNQAPTPMDVTKGPALSSAGVSYNSILAQSKQANDSLGVVEKQLKDKNLKLKRSQSHLVRQKLNDANNYIHAAGSKLGLNLKEGKIPPGVSGISRFIAMINSGQDQLAQVQEELNKMAASGAQINAGTMMSVQVKMGLATQQIEYTSTLLGKVIQSVTQLMNTQL